MDGGEAGEAERGGEVDAGASGGPGAIGGSGSAWIDRGGASGNGGVGCCADAAAAIEPTNKAAATKLRVMGAPTERSARVFCAV